MSERLQKYLARAGVASRRHAEELITAGRISVNNKTVTELGSRVEPGKDLVTVDGTLVEPPAKSAYYLLYKPAGVVTTLSDPQGRPTVASYIEETGRRLFPVGRLDYDAEGALLFTDDGELAHKLTHPSFQVPRVYLAKVKGVPDAATLEKLRGGVRLEDGMATPVSVDVHEVAERNTWLKIVVAEGRPHLIKRLCAAVGHPVVRLYRPTYAGVNVAGSRPGELRPLTSSELKLLHDVSEGRVKPTDLDLRLPPRRHGRAAPGFEEEPELTEEEDEGGEEAPPRRPAQASTKGAGRTAFSGRAPKQGFDFGASGEGGGSDEEKGEEELPQAPQAKGGKPSRGAALEQRRPARSEPSGSAPRGPGREDFSARGASGGKRSERPSSRGGEGRTRSSGGGAPARGPAGRAESSGRGEGRGAGGRTAGSAFSRRDGGAGGRPERKGFAGRGAGSRPERKGFADAGARAGFATRGAPARGEGRGGGGRPERGGFAGRGAGTGRPSYGARGEGAERGRPGRPARSGFAGKSTGEGRGYPARPARGGPAERGRGGRAKFGDDAAAPRGRPTRSKFGEDERGGAGRSDFGKRGAGGSFAGRSAGPRGERGAGAESRGPRRAPSEDRAPRGRESGGFGAAGGERPAREGFKPKGAGRFGALPRAGREGRKPGPGGAPAWKKKGTEPRWSSQAPRGTGRGKPPRGR